MWGKDAAYEVGSLVQAHIMSPISDASLAVPPFCCLSGKQWLGYNWQMGPHGDRKCDRVRNVAQVIHSTKYTSGVIPFELNVPAAFNNSHGL